MPRPLARVGRQDERVFLAALLDNLDQVSLEDYTVGVDGAIGRLAEFARNYWTGQSKQFLWDASAPIWRKVRESIALADDHNHSRRYLWSVAVRTNIEDIAFLAAVATRDYDDKVKAGAQNRLRALISATVQEDGVDNRALQLLASLTLRTRVVAQESPTPWFLYEETVTSEMSTLTARAFSTGGRAFFEEERDRTIAPSLRSSAIEKPGAAELELLKRFDSAEHLHEKDEVLYALQVIGGCRASQELSSRLAGADSETQCAILAVLEKLANRPYRPGTSDKEHPVLQLETADTILRALGQLIIGPAPDRVRQLLKDVNQAVTAHRTNCFNSHH